MSAAAHDAIVEWAHGLALLLEANPGVRSVRVAFDSGAVLLNDRGRCRLYVGDPDGPVDMDEVLAGGTFELATTEVERA